MANQYGSIKPITAPGERKWPDAIYETPALTEEVASGIFHTQFSIENYDLCDRIDLYAVVDDGDVLFLDVGYWEVCGRSALEEIMNQGHSWDSAQVVITHFHDDHAGNIDYCLEQGVKAVYHAPRVSFDIDVLEQFVQITGWSADSEGLENAVTILNALWDNYVYPDFVGTEVENGERIKVGKREFEVIYTPGHSPDHISLFDPQEKILFGGDHIAETGPGIIQFSPDEHLIVRYLDNLDYMRSLQLQSIYGSHGDAFIGQEAVNRVLDTTESFLEKSLQKRYENIKELGTVSALELSYAAKGKDAFLARPLRHRARAVAANFAFLEALVDRGQLTMSIDSNGIYRYSDEKN